MHHNPRSSRMAHRPAGRLGGGTIRTFFLVVAISIVTACGGSDTVTADQSIETVSPDGAATLIADQSDLVVLDIRTPEEFAGPRLANAVNIDFYAPDFAEQLDQLDKSVPYVVYCRSGNRSGQAMPVFAGLGFTVVNEIDGGIVSWAEAGLPLDG